MSNRRRRMNQDLGLAGNSDRERSLTTRKPQTQSRAIVRATTFSVGRGNGFWMVLVDSSKTFQDAAAGRTGDLRNRRSGWGWVFPGRI